MLEQNIKFIEGLYLALLDRMPDEGGLNYWVSAMDKGATRENIVHAFLAGNEFFAREGSPDSSEVIETVYSNAFDRPAENQGLQYWSDAVTQGVSLDHVVNQILSVMDDTKNTDGQRLTNAIQSVEHTRETAIRLAVGNYWQGAEVDGITSDPASVTQQDFTEQIRLGASVTAAPQIRFDNAIYGDKIDTLVIEGTNLNDYIVFGAKTLSVFARDGDDFIQGSDLGTMFWPGNGNDTVEAGGGSDIIDARPDAPASVRDTFYGQDGDDFIWGGAGKELIDGGDGNDFISAGGGDDIVRGGIGSDQIIKDGDGQFNILGEAGDDKITVTGKDSFGVINGGTGKDIINVDGIVSVSIYAGTGDDTATISNINAGSYVFMEDGNDTVTGLNLKSTTIDMGTGNDHLVLRHASNVTVNLGDGDNTIEIYDSDNVVVLGGQGKDNIHITNSTNINADGGGGEVNNFYVDVQSLASKSLKLDGDSKYWDSTLNITDLKDGNWLALNQDNFKNFYYLNFNYDARATIVFESNDSFGVGGLSSMWLKNTNNQTTDIRSDIWIMHGQTPFSNTQKGIFEFNNPGVWYLDDDVLTWTWEEGSSGKMFFHDVPKVYNPYVFDGNLMLSWVV